VQGFLKELIFLFSWSINDPLLTVAGTHPFPEEIHILIPVDVL
jgi:hypothetical protein